MDGCKHQEFESNIDALLGVRRLKGKDFRG